MRHPKSEKPGADARAWGWAMLSTTLTFMCIPIAGLFDSPVFLLEKHWDMYLLFVFGPIAAALILFWIGRRLDKKQGREVR